MGERACSPAVLTLGARIEAPAAFVAASTTCWYP